MLWVVCDRMRVVETQLEPELEGAGAKAGVGVESGAEAEAGASKLSGL